MPLIPWVPIMNMQYYTNKFFFLMTTNLYTNLYYIKKIKMVYNMQSQFQIIPNIDFFCLFEQPSLWNLLNFFLQFWIPDEPWKIIFRLFLLKSKRYTFRLNSTSVSLTPFRPQIPYFYFSCVLSISPGQNWG